jgi:hypothetical protein
VKLKVYLRGGLGNQLFQYSTALALAKTKNFDLELDATLLPGQADSYKNVSRWPEQISSFNHEGRMLNHHNQPAGRTSLNSKFLTSTIFMEKGLSPLLGTRSTLVSDENINLFFRDDFVPGKDLRLYGYFQKDLLFNKYMEDICRQLLDLNNPSRQYRDLLSSWDFSGFAIHARLGDKAVLDIDYPRKLLENMIATINQFGLAGKKFVIFTDSPEFFSQLSSEIFSDATIFSGGEISPIENLLLLARHKFIAGSESTFFWWVTRVQKVFNTLASSIQY